MYSYQTSFSEELRFLYYTILEEQNISLPFSTLYYTYSLISDYEYREEILEELEDRMINIINEERKLLREKDLKKEKK